MNLPREKGSVITECICKSESERAADCPIHGEDTAREKASTAVRELGS